jgi:cytochrome-b5 reductase
MPLTLLEEILGPNAIVFACTAFAMLASFLLFLSKGEKPAMDPDNFQPFKLIQREEISHDTRRFTFALQSPTRKLGLPVGQHISLRFVDTDGKGVQRSYTPVSGDETPGQVSFVIKVYKAGEHPKFPAGGKMSQHLDSLQIGDTIEMKGPKGHMTYKGQGKFHLKLLRKPLEERHAKHFGMIAGGTGITPMLQVLHAIFRDEKDTTTTASLLFANQTEDDILVREELEALAKSFPDRFKLQYTLDRPSDNWKGCKGFVDKNMIEKYVLRDGKTEGVQILMCGPPPMIKFACIPGLEALGLDEKSWFTF